MLFYMIVHAQRRHCWLSPFAFLLSLVDCVCVSVAMLAKQGSTETVAYISMVCPASMLTRPARKARLLTAIKYADTASENAFPHTANWQAPPNDIGLHVLSVLLESTVAVVFSAIVPMAWCLILVDPVLRTLTCKCLPHLTGR